MIELVLVILIVAAAAFYVAGRIARQLKGRGCGDCNCVDSDKTEPLLQIRVPDRSDKSRDR